MIPGEDLVKSGSSNPIIIKLLKAAIHGLVSSDYNLFFMRKKGGKNVCVCVQSGWGFVHVDGFLFSHTKRVQNEGEDVNGFFM